MESSRLVAAAAAAGECRCAFGDLVSRESGSDWLARHANSLLIGSGVGLTVGQFPLGGVLEQRSFGLQPPLVTEWVFAGTRDDGVRVEVQGCDVFTFRDGKIAVKNSCRKQRSGY